MSDTDLTKKKVVPARDNYRIVLQPNTSYYVRRTNEQRRDDDLAACNEALNQIRRHCDWGKFASLDFDLVCPFCGDLWEKEPGCCNAVVEAIATETKP